MGKDNSGKFAIAAVVAAAAGYVAGILTAPKSGKETRKDIKDMTAKQLREIEAQLKKVHTELNNLIQDATERLNKASGNAKSEFEQRIAQATKAKDKVRVALSGVREGETSDKDLQRAISDAEKAIEHLKAYLKK